MPRDKGLRVNGSIGGGASLVLEFSIASGGRPCWRVEMDMQNDHLTVDGARNIEELISEVGREISMRVDRNNGSFTPAHFSVFTSLVRSIQSAAHAGADVPIDVVYH